MSDLAAVDRWYAIESGGGPLLLLPAAAVGNWTGGDGADYDRACAVDDYLGVIAVGNDQGLVIGDAPASTALLPTHASDSVVIVKWTYAPDKASVIASLSTVRLDRFPAPEVAFTFRSSPQRLFDSAIPGNQLQDSLTTQLPAGNYVASTLVFEPTRDISLVLHWVRAAGSTV